MSGTEVNLRSFCDPIRLDGALLGMTILADYDPTDPPEVIEVMPSDSLFHTRGQFFKFARGARMTPEYVQIFPTKVTK